MSRSHLIFSRCKGEIFALKSTTTDDERLDIKANGHCESRFNKTYFDRGSTKDRNSNFQPTGKVALKAVANLQVSLIYRKEQVWTTNNKLRKQDFVRFSSHALVELAHQLQKCWKTCIKALCAKRRQLRCYHISDLFRLCPPPYVMPPQLQSTYHYIVDHCENMARPSGGCKEYAPANLGGGGTNMKRSHISEDKNQLCSILCIRGSRKLRRREISDASMVAVFEEGRLLVSLIYFCLQFFVFQCCLSFVLLHQLMLRYIIILLINLNNKKYSKKT